MLCISLTSYARQCNTVTGGMSDMALFDPSDFNFTQAGAIAGVTQPYSAVALRPGATGSGATAATCTVTITAIGSDGDIISVYYAGTLLGSFTKTAAESTTTLLAAALKTAINNLTTTTGFSASNVAGVITITAPASYGATINTQNVVVDDTGGITSSKTAFSGGVTGTGGKMYVVNFQRDEAEYQWKQSVKGCSVKYEHTFNFQLPENSQSLGTFMQALDAASCCCGLGIVFRLNDGKIFVCGEKYVNGSEISRFTVLNNGSSGSSGKLYDDFNGANMVLVGPYSRPLYEFSGTWDAITALM